MNRWMAHLHGVQEEVPVIRWSTFLQRQKGTKGTMETVTGCRLQLAGWKFYRFVLGGTCCRKDQRSEEGSNGVTRFDSGEGSRPGQLNLTRPALRHSGHCPGDSAFLLPHSLPHPSNREAGLAFFKPCQLMLVISAGP